MQFVIKQLGFSIITTYIINFTKRKSSDLYISKHSLWPKTFFMRKYSLGYKNKIDKNYIPLDLTYGSWGNENEFKR